MFWAGRKQRPISRHLHIQQMERGGVSARGAKSWGGARGSTFQLCGKGRSLSPLLERISGAGV